jgi:hypothetical protein
MRHLNIVTATMTKQHKIDWTLYIVDDRTRTYEFLKRDPEWKQLDACENSCKKDFPGRL